MSLSRDSYKVEVGLSSFGWPSTWYWHVTEIEGILTRPLSGPSGYAMTEAGALRKADRAVRKELRKKRSIREVVVHGQTHT